MDLFSSGVTWSALNGESDNAFNVVDVVLVSTLAPPDEVGAAAARRCCCCCWVSLVLAVRLSPTLALRLSLTLLSNTHS